jgi:hypothetical protein
MADRYAITEAGALAMRVVELERLLRHFDGTSMDLHLYVRAIDGLPTEPEWTLIREQIAEMVDAYGPRNADR